MRLRFVKQLQRFLNGCKCSAVCSSHFGGVNQVSRRQNCVLAAKHIQRHQYVRCSSSLAQEFKRATDEHQKHHMRKVFRCEENDPIKHTKDHEGLFYRVPDDEVKQLFQRGLSTAFMARTKTFQETCFMVRKPALEVLDILGKTNYNHPPLKFLFYGEKGTGKSQCIAHVLHYGARTGCLLVHVPWPALWVMFAKESDVSSHNPERRDLPLEALEWLGHFKSQNFKLLQELKTSKAYTWSKREITEEGSNLVEVVDHGLNRGKHASDCVGVILKEAKKQASEKRCRLMVAIDGVNGLWRESELQDEDKKIIPSEKISLIHHFKRLISDEWCNGSIVASVDTFAVRHRQREEYTPIYLLRNEGFELFDPFIPVRVDVYSDKEVYSALEYFTDRRWIQHPKGKTEEGRKELIYKSGKNPYLLDRAVAPL